MLYPAHLDPLNDNQARALLPSDIVFLDTNNRTITVDLTGDLLAGIMGQANQRSVGAIVESATPVPQTLLMPRIIRSTAPEPAPSSASNNNAVRKRRDRFVIQTREWLADGACRFVVALAAGSEAHSILKQKYAVSVRVCRDDPHIFEVVSNGTILLSLSSPVNVAVNDSRLKFSRARGVLDVTIPVFQCCPLNARAGIVLPRCTFGASKTDPAAPHLVGKVIKSLSSNPPSWYNVELSGKLIPLPLRKNLNTTMGELRRSIFSILALDRDQQARASARPDESNEVMFVALRCGLSKGATLFLSSNVFYDAVYGAVIPGAVFVNEDDDYSKKALVSDVVIQEFLNAALKQNGKPPRMIELNEDCGEFECWTDMYLPAAASLACLARGLPSFKTPSSLCVCSSQKQHDSKNCKQAIKFWLSWLGCQKLPVSTNAMIHFVPIVIFPIFSPVISLVGGAADSEKAKKDFRAMFEECRKEITNERVRNPRMAIRELLSKFQPQANPGAGEQEKLAAEVQYAQVCVILIIARWPYIHTHLI